MNEQGDGYGVALFLFALLAGPHPVETFFSGGADLTYKGLCCFPFLFNRCPIVVEISECSMNLGFRKVILFHHLCN